MHTLSVTNSTKHHHHQGDESTDTEGSGGRAVGPTRPSLHGWHWVLDDDGAAGHQRPKVAHKRKPGCLGRRKPARMISEPAMHVVSASEFVAYQQEQRHASVAKRSRPQ